jgi:hypothetical protein
MKRTIDVVLGDGLQVGKRVKTCKGVAKALLSNTTRAGSATPRVSLLGRRFRSRRDHNSIAS